MSLQVWLPLTNGTLKQQGLKNAAATIDGTVGLTDAGKLGKCATIGTAAGRITLPASTMTSFTECSVAFWIKIISWNTSYATFFQAGLSSTAWNNYIFGILRNNANSNLCFTLTNSSGSSSSAAYTTSNLNTGQWYHLAFTYKAGTICTYIDGTLDKTYSTTYVPNFAGITNISIGKGTNNSSYQTNCNLNDFRIYNHCLSPMEVKELAKGLVLHYPLSDNSIQSLDNCYAYPRFETSNSNGGWSHWGSSGHVGTYGQTTNTNYIFRNGQTYAHWVADGSSATKDYLLYQEPAFDGGLRSLVAICKEENSKPITNDICYATWNARNGGVANNSWTSIQSLGNGFYLCKCEGISQDGSNDLVGIYIKPGYKIYFSEVYLENNRSISSDMFFPTNIVYDCSGLCNNSILNTSATVSADTAKYTHSTYFGEYNTPKTDLIDNSLLPALTNCTITWWEKNDTTRTLLLTGQTTSHYIAASDNNTYYHGTVNGTKTLYRDGVAGTYKCEAGVWHHYALVGVDISTWTALHLNSYGSYWYLKGLVSDLRIYATALSANDVKSLYQNSAYIDSSGNVYGTIHEV